METVGIAFGAEWLASLGDLRPHIGEDEVCSSCCAQLGRQERGDAAASAGGSLDELIAL